MLIQFVLGRVSSAFLNGGLVQSHRSHEQTKPYEVSHQHTKHHVIYDTHYFSALYMYTILRFPIRTEDDTSMIGNLLVE